MPNNESVAVVTSFVCQYCDTTHEGEGNIVNDETWCDECRDDWSFNCERCSDNFHHDDAHDVQGDTICTRCYDRHADYCSDCERDYYTNDGCYCSNDDDSEGRDFNDRDMKLVLNDGRKHTFGVEIEAENGNAQDMITKLPKSAGVHHDGSLSNGAEVVTPPLTLAGMDDYIPIICSALRTSGYDATDSCGLHVHVKPAVSIGTRKRNGRVITKEEKRTEVIKMVVKVMSVIEGVIFEMLPVARKDGRWTQKLARNKHLLNAVNGVEGKIKKVNDFERFIDSRYFGINLCSLRKYGTIEFRYHSGTTDDVKIMNWVRIIDRIISFCEEIVSVKLGSDSCSRSEYERWFRLLNMIDSAVTMRQKRALVYKHIIKDIGLITYMRTRVAKFASGHFGTGERELKVASGASSRFVSVR